MHGQRAEQTNRVCVFFLSDFLLLDTYKNEGWGGGGSWWGLKYIDFFFDIHHMWMVDGWPSRGYTHDAEHAATPATSTSALSKEASENVRFCLSVDGSETGYSPHLTWSFMHAPAAVQLIGSSWAAEEWKLGPLRLLWLEHSITTTTNHHHN